LFYLSFFSQQGIFFQFSFVFSLHLPKNFEKYFVNLKIKKNAGLIDLICFCWESITNLIIEAYSSLVTSALNNEIWSIFFYPNKVKYCLTRCLACVIICQPGISAILRKLSPLSAKTNVRRTFMPPRSKIRGRGGAYCFCPFCHSVTHLSSCPSVVCQKTLTLAITFEW
jgi:hypothetical protein